MKVHSWLLTKKRGMHRTDSRTLGVITEFAFAFFCVSAGLVGLFWIFTFFILPEWQVHERFEKVQCTFLDSRISKRSALGIALKEEETENSQSIFEDSGNTPEENLISEEKSSKKTADSNTIHPGLPERVVNGIRVNLHDICYWPELQLKYKVGEVERTNWTSGFGSIIQSSDFPDEESAQSFLAQWKKGETYDGFYNPENPDQIVIMHGWRWENYIALVIPVSLLLIGAGVLIHAFTIPHAGSKESSAAHGAKRGVLESAASANVNFTQYPYIPQIDDITDSPGIHFAYRLPIIDSPAWTLCILVFATLTWNFGCVLFLTIAACSFLQTFSDCLLLFYLFPFLLFGIWLMVHTLTQIRNATAIGPTIMEVEDFPLLPGRTVRMFLSQRGEQRINWMNVVLICEEEAVFTHGTNTRREKQRVFQQLIFGEEGIDVSQEKSFDVEIPLTIPSDAMHSFAAPRNQINWRVLIQGTTGLFPMFERIFPLVVLPGKIQREEEI